MIPQVIEARHVKDYRVWMKFQDGTEGEIDLKNELWGEVFEALKDISFFQTLKVDPELHTIVWPNGADLAPEFLYQRLRSNFSLNTASGKTGPR
jgi:hypothetical protein